jgi:hypothetical protein
LALAITLHMMTSPVQRRRRSRVSTRTLGTQLAATLFAVLTVTVTFALVVRHPRLFVPVLSGQTVLLAAAGGRWPVLTAALALCVLVANAWPAPLSAPGLDRFALTAVAILAVTGVRAAHGRSLQDTDSRVPARAAALATAVTPKGTPGRGQPRTSRAGRGAVLMGTRSPPPSSGTSPGEPRHPAVARESLMTVPSVLWPSKLGAVG